MKKQKTKQLFSENKERIEVKLDDLKIHPDNPRLRYDKKDLKNLANSIESVGQLNPIIIDEEGYILSGNRRYLAMRDILLWEYAVCDVRTDLKDYEKKAVVISANTTQKSLDIWKNRESIADLYWNEFLENYKPFNSEDKGYTAFGKLIGISHTYVAKIVVPFSIENKKWVTDFRKLNIHTSVVDEIIASPKAFQTALVKETYDYKKKNPGALRDDVRDFVRQMRRDMMVEKKGEVTKSNFSFIKKRLNEFGKLLTESTIDNMTEKQKEEILNKLELYIEQIYESLES